MVDQDLVVRGCANEWEPGNHGVPRWLAIGLAVIGSGVMAALGTLAVACYRLMTPT